MEKIVQFPLRQTFIVHGKPEPQSRPRMGRKSIYDPTQKYKRDAGLQVMSQRPIMIKEGPIHVGLLFKMPRPKRAPKSLYPGWHKLRPDLDNLIKAILDALNGIVWEDDSQVCSIHAHKLYSNESGTRIVIERLEDKS